MSATMRAVVLHRPGHLLVETVPVPELQPGQQLIKVRACGICGSDLRYLAGENPWAKHTLGTTRPNPPEMILGHEIGGEAEIAGQARSVGCLAFKACGHCDDCRRGQIQLCANTAHLGHGAGWQDQNPGGMAGYCPVWSEHLYPLPDGVSVEEATLLDGLAVAVHAVRQAQTFPGRDILVLGGGPIGLLIGQAARALGAGRAVMTDIYEAPLQCAQELGLGPCFNLVEDGEEALKQVSGDFGTVFDTTGELEAQNLGLKLLGRGGTMALMAGAAEGLRLTPSTLAGERRLMTCSNHLYDDFGIGLSMLAEGRVRVGPMITHRFDLEDAVKAFAVASDKVNSGAIKVILKP